MTGDSRIPSIQIHSDATPAGGGLDLGPIHRVTLRGVGRVLHVRAWGIPILNTSTPDAGKARMRLMINDSTWVTPAWTPREWTTLDIDLKTVAQKIFIEGDVVASSQDLHLRDILLT
jgi:hypothetical protein